MDNAMVLAGRTMSRRLLMRLSILAVGVSVALAALMTFLQERADAQINFGGLFCSILLAVANAFGGFFGGIFRGIINALLNAFGCGISG